MVQQTQDEEWQVQAVQWGHLVQRTQDEDEEPVAEWEPDEESELVAESEQEEQEEVLQWLRFPVAIP